jgi:hypothetical protein
MHFSRTVKIVISFLAVAITAVIYLATQSQLAKAVPASFNNARMQGALISQTIVDLSNKLRGDLGQVNELDKNKKTAEALELTSKLIEQSQEIRAKAIELSKEMEAMATSLPEIQSEEARLAAVNAISSRLLLINKLVSYSGYLTELLEALRNRFAGSAVSQEQVGTLIEKINAEVTAINNFNRQATASMERFDELIRAGR